MSEEILINVTPKEVRVALLEQNVLQEVHIERSFRQGLLGNIYKGRVSRLLPGIQAAFIDIGLDRSAFLHISDLHGYNKQETDKDIRDFLHPGQELLVQVYKDPLGSKGARLTTLYTIPSRYLVFTPDVSQVAVSQKIVDETERTRLLSLVTSDPQGGYIFRTAAEGMSADDAVAEKKFLAALWDEISARIKTAKVGTLVYEEIPMVLRVLRDLVGHEVEKIRVDDQAAVTAMRDFAKRYMPAFVDRIEYYADVQPIFDLHAVEEELQKALERKVLLKSGGHVIFDQTEAMTTIDVNTGSYVGRENSEATIFKINLEAAEAIARQLRLRNLGGIIIIDFIDMMEPQHKTQLLQAFSNALVKDSVRAELSEITSLGLVQMTRKRTRESLERILCVSCPTCQQRGSIKSLATICYDIFRKLKRTAQHYPWTGFMIVASAEVIACLQEEESAMLADLEIQLKKPIKLRADAAYKQEYYDILPI